MSSGGGDLHGSRPPISSGSRQYNAPCGAPGADGRPPVWQHGVVRLGEPLPRGTDTIRMVLSVEAGREWDQWRIHKKLTYNIPMYVHVACLLERGCFECITATAKERYVEYLQSAWEHFYAVPTHNDTCTANHARTLLRLWTMESRQRTTEKTMSWSMKGGVFSASPVQRSVPPLSWRVAGTSARGFHKDAGVPIWQNTPSDSCDTQLSRPTVSLRHIAESVGSDYDSDT